MQSLVRFSVDLCSSEAQAGGFHCSMQGTIYQEITLDTVWKR